MRPFFLQSVCKDYIWGGNRLREYGKVSDQDRIAESWELSCHPDGESVIASGEFQGMPLTAFLKEYPEAQGKNCRQFDRFPLLIKLIDAKENLSLQVHPDNAYALAHEHDWGKTELWYIIDAEPEAEILYGFAHTLTKEQFRSAIEQHTVLELVQHIPVKAGDVFYIPAGTVHAIGKGILLAEIQQSSNLTYRIYDYDRDRELHIEQAMSVTRLAGLSGCAPQYRKQCRFFSVEEIRGKSGIGKENSFCHLLILEGEGILNTEETALPVHKGDSLFIPAGISGQLSGTCTAISTFVPECLSTDNYAHQSINIKEDILS